jgi:hypothetical protein
VWKVCSSNQPLSFSLAPRRVDVRSFIGFYFSRLHIPCPTPSIESTVSANAQAQEYIQMRLLGASLWVVILDNDRVQVLEAHGTSEIVAQTYNISRKKQEKCALI